VSSPEPRPKFDHLVVLMFENRSFDNLLGQLYQPGEVPEFDGVLGKELSNPIPAGARDADRKVVTVHSTTERDLPDPDPGEEYPHTNVQLYGAFVPDTNERLPVGQMVTPFNRPADPRQTPTMDGFVADYITAYRADTGREPEYDDYSQILACYGPEQVPVLSTLARGFACFDRWFCEVPSQTYANRSFVHAATSSGFVVNDPPGKFPSENAAETIFDRLEKAKIPWKIYFDRLQLVSATGLIHARRLTDHFGTHFASMEEFFHDVAHGLLPAYSFVEPCLIPPHSDMHPPGASRLRRILFFLPRPASIQGGEALLARVYQAVRGSKSPNGSNFQNTLLLVTFDENGGLYDHVPPPSVPPPDPAGPPGEKGFRFDLSGLRVPAIAISAWIDPRTVVHEEYRHTSVIRTLRGRWPLGDPLTARDAAARDLAPLLSRTVPRPPEEWPLVEAPLRGRISKFLETIGRPLPKLGGQLMASAVALEASRSGKASSVDVTRVSRRAALRHVRGFRHAAFPKVTSRRRR
jgi:phospholipase C